MKNLKNSFQVIRYQQSALDFFTCINVRILLSDYYQDRAAYKERLEPRQARINALLQKFQISLDSLLLIADR